MLKDVKETTDILIIEDHYLFAEGLKLIIERESNLNVVGLSQTINDGYDSICKMKPDIILVDINLGDSLTGIELVSRVCNKHPDTKFIVLSMYEEEIYAERAIRAGAVGYVMKKEMPSVLYKAITKVLNGEVYLSRKVVSRVLKSVIKSDKDNNPQSSDCISQLSNREFEIFRLMGQGHKTSKIAKISNVSVKTIDTHKLRIRKKLNIGSSSDLQTYAVNWALLHKS